MINILYLFWIIDRLNKAFRQMQQSPKEEQAQLDYKGLDKD